jgi:ABC-type transporter Mla maintaining outer membrane lipid asymmetry permease subunit MlaE
VGGGQTGGEGFDVWVLRGDRECLDVAGTMEQLVFERQVGVVLIGLLCIGAVGSTLTGK